MDKPVDLKEKLAALVSLAESKIHYDFYRFPDTKFMMCAAITSKGFVICTGYAQRHKGEYINEVAVSYSKQNAEQGVKAQLQKLDEETLLLIANEEI